MVKKHYVPRMQIDWDTRPSFVWFGIRKKNSENDQKTKGGINICFNRKPFGSRKKINSKQANWGGRMKGICAAVN